MKILLFTFFFLSVRYFCPNPGNAAHVQHAVIIIITHLLSRVLHLFQNKLSKFRTFSYLYFVYSVHLFPACRTRNPGNHPLPRIFSENRDSPSPNDPHRQLHACVESTENGNDAVLYTNKVFFEEQKLPEPG